MGLVLMLEAEVEQRSEKCRNLRDGPGSSVGAEGTRIRYLEAEIATLNKALDVLKREA